MVFLLHLAALFTCGVLLGKVTGCTVKMTYDNTGQDNRLFDESLVFDLNNNIRSVLDCARACLNHDRCEVFTVVQTASKLESCRGHSADLTSNSKYHSVNGSRTFRLETKNFDSCDPCAPGAHAVLDEAWRELNEEKMREPDEYVCDYRYLIPGWYRFLINGTSAEMPTVCTPMYHCGTFGTVWLDLGGASLPEVGQELNGRACHRYYSDCCLGNLKRPLTVKNCGSFYVYRIALSAGCPFAICTVMSRANTVD